MKKIIGVYEIRNTLNNHRYIGSSVNITKRWKEHICALKANRHGNCYLQNAWNKYTEISFSFKILEECTKEEILKVEQKYIDNSNPEYNICKIAGNTTGRSLSKEAREKIGIANSKRKIKETTRAKHSLLSKNSDWNKKQRKAVLMLDSETNIILMEFDSISDAAKYLGHINKRVSIKRVLQGKYKTAYSYMWKLKSKQNASI